MSKFVRPSSLPFPHNYHTFHAKNKAGNATIEYQIRELPEELYEQALELLAKDFSTEETLFVAKGIPTNSMALKEVCFDWFRKLTERISLGCFANDGSNELAGVAVMTVIHKDDEEENFKPSEKEMIEHQDLLEYIMKQHNVFEKYGVDMYLSDYALCTKKEFRYRGIATEFIRSLTQMMKVLNIPVTSSVYTVIGSQKAAVKAGHTETLKISYNELVKSYPTFDFSKSNAEFVKFFDFKL